jgi:hypothetical protein
MPIRGVVGQIKWVYHMAGAIHGYSVARVGPAAWTLAGRLVMADSFNLAQRPLTFVAPHKHGEWRWPITDLTVVDGNVSAQLGAIQDVRK